MQKVKIRVHEEGEPMFAIASSCACLPPGIRDGSRSSSQSSTFPQVRCRRTLILCSGMEIHRLSESEEESEEEKPAPSSRTISIFWDLDNKPPTTSPFAAAMHLKMAASAFGSVRETLAFANRHAFSYVPEWVRDERRERKILDILEKKGAVKPTSPYVCSLCGRKCKTNLDLKKHFKQLHERERQKRINRLGQLKGKRRTKFRDSISAKEERYREASRDVLLPKRGYGLAQELRRAGVFVRTVEDKPQAADEAIKRRMAAAASLGGAVDCVCLVSDDSDFGEMLRDARLRRLRTVVIGETKALHRYADAWLSWDEVAAGAARRRAAQAAKRWDAQESLARELLDDREEREAMVDEDLKRLDYRSRLLLLDSSSSMDLRDEGGGLLLPSTAARSIIWTSAFSEAEEDEEDEDDEEQEGFFGEEEEAEDNGEDDVFQAPIRDILIT